MYLTTSKHAGKELQALARRLASHLPSCRYLPRSERALERLQTLATRAGEDTIVVVSSPQTERPAQGKKKKSAAKKASSLPLAVFSSRSHSSDGWAWHKKSLSLHKIKFGTPLSLVREDDPLEIKISSSTSSHALSSFLGLHAGKTQPIFAESTPVAISATFKKAKLSSGKTLLLELDYAWC